MGVGFVVEEREYCIITGGTMWCANLEHGEHCAPKLTASQFEVQWLDMGIRHGEDQLKVAQNCFAIFHESLISNSLLHENNEILKV